MSLSMCLYVDVDLLFYTVIEVNLQGKLQTSDKDSLYCEYWLHVCVLCSALSCLSFTFTSSYLSRLHNHQSLHSPVWLLLPYYSAAYTIVHNSKLGRKELVLTVIFSYFSLPVSTKSAIVICVILIIRNWSGAGPRPSRQPSCVTRRASRHENPQAVAVCPRGLINYTPSPHRQTRKIIFQHDFASIHSSNIQVKWTKKFEKLIHIISIL